MMTDKEKKRSNVLNDRANKARKKNMELILKNEEFRTRIRRLEKEVKKLKDELEKERKR
jgi:hypothetical protein